MLIQIFEKSGVNAGIGINLLSCFVRQICNEWQKNVIYFKNDKKVGIPFSVYNCSKHWILVLGKVTLYKKTSRSEW